MPLLSRAERQRLHDEIINLFLESGAVYTARQLATYCCTTRTNIWTILIDLRAVDWIEPAGLCLDGDNAGCEIAWTLTAHVEYHGGLDRQPGCRGCRIQPEEW